MARSGSMTYNPQTGTWSSSPVTSSGPSTKTQNSGINKNTQANTGGTSASTSTSLDNLTASTSNKDTSAGSAEKEYNEIEYNILSGSLNFIATKKTIKLRAGDTVNIQGIGKYLSGLYFVQDVTRQISSNGYSHSATLIKTDFGNSLKQQQPAQQQKQQQQQQQPVQQQKHYQLKKGECLWTVAKKYYGSGAAFEKIAKANGISPSQYTKLPIGLDLVIP